jgi:hypothetical protein
MKLVIYILLLLSIILIIFPFYLISKNIKHPLVKSNIFGPICIMIGFILFYISIYGIVFNI